MCLGRGSSVAILLLALTPPAFARTADQSRTMPKFQQGDASGIAPWASRNRQVFGVATAGTTFYGGTFWAADSMRWEANENQLWTFDTGVGSSIVPPGGPSGLSEPTASWVNPYKPHGHHATMEGWIGYDNTYSEITYFRRVASDDPRWTTNVCTGVTAGLEGAYSYWCGVFPSEADLLCYTTGQGYGNSWNVCLEQVFNYAGGTVTLGFQFKNESEEGFDYTHVYVDTSGDGDNVEVTRYSGVTSGVVSFPLMSGIELPRVPKPITIKFCVESDGAWSDQDALNPTECGAFALDNITLTGAIIHTATFETSDDGWHLGASREGQGGEWSNLSNINDLPPILAPCACALSDSVLTFFNLNYAYQSYHNNYQDNLAASPWIDLKAYGKVGSVGKIIKTNIYAQLPLLNYIFAQFNAQWYPEVCAFTGKLATSSWTSNGFIYYFGGVPQCTSTLPGTLGVQVNFSAVIPPGSEQVRIALGALSYCRFFAGCTQTSNTTPWFDYVGLGVYGDPHIPFIQADEAGRAQDNFPENGTLNFYATGRVDCSDIQGAMQPEVGTTLGDTLVVKGALGNAEVYVHFRVVPGPGTHPSRFQAWYRRHAVSTIEPDFRAARMDTAEFGNSGPVSGTWMTAYHENDPNFWGTDRALDPTDVTPTGGMWRLDNDIFPDDLFTAGTRLDYFFTGNNVGESNYIRDPVSGYYEMEILPSSMTNQRTWNCVLYVDHFNQGNNQELIENGLTSILGTGSENAESTNWDRYDLNVGPMQLASFGRPLQTDYGASVSQAFAYRTILWDSGNLNASNLTKEDADVLLPWLTLDGMGTHNLYLSGDGLVYSATHESESEPSAAELVQNLAGVSLRTTCSLGSFRVANCPAAGAPLDLTPCVNLDPVGGALVAGHPSRSVGQVAQGNGCPQLRSFDVLSLLTPAEGVPIADENYVSPLKSASYASAAIGVAGKYNIVVDGVSVGYRRDLGTPCDDELGGKSAIAARLNEVLTYFGYAGLNPPCSDPTIGVGLPPEGPEPPAFITHLGDFSPNPFTAGREGRLHFTLAKDAPARVDVLDLQGRLVTTIFNGSAKMGDNEATWDGRDRAGANVAKGLYFYRFRALDQDQAKKVVIVGWRN